jgi:hypothetical protein
MGTIYRKQWTATNGHTYTLDIVPYDTDTDETTVVTLSAADANLVEVGTITHAFDEVPVGLMTPPSMTCKVVINRLPSALQTALRAKFIEFAGPGGYVARNLFILKSDYGVAGAVNVVFCGVQARINSQSYERQSGEYIVEIELQDAMQWTMSSIKPSNSLAWTALQESTRKIRRIAWELRAPNVGDGLYDAVYDTGLTNLDERLEFHTWEQSFGAIMDYISQEAKKMSIRSTSTFNTADYGLDWESSDALGIMQLYNTNGWTVASGRPRGSTLTNATTYLCTHITQNGQTIGGLASPLDKYGWTRYESWWDFFKDISETMFLKVSYKYAIDTVIEPGVVNVTWEIRPVISTNVATVDIMDSLDEPNIEETASAIGRCETRFAAEYGDATVTQHIANAGVARADRQYTVDMVMHNVPLFKGRREDLRFGIDPYIAEPGLQHCNQFWFWDTSVSPNEIVKVHENMKIKWGAGSGDAFDYNALIADTPPYDKEAHNAWAIEVQRTTGMPASLANAYVSLFGDDNLATVEIRTRLMDYRMFVGDRMTISGQVTSDVPHLAWSNAVITSVETDVTAGTQTVIFMLIPTP